MNKWLHKWHSFVCGIVDHDWAGTTWVDGLANRGPWLCRRCFARGEPFVRFRKSTDIVGYIAVLREGVPDGYPRGHGHECQEFGYWDIERRHHDGNPRDKAKAPQWQAMP